MARTEMQEITITSSDHILETSRDYSIYVCQSRGIPNICDGLKDSQRKALFVIKSINEKVKTVSLAGQMISSVYLHGDVSASEAISLMAAPYCNNVTLLHGIGAFGTRVGPTDWGAPRYTYVKKSQHTDRLIYPDYDIIPLKENYDGSVMEPQNFLPLIPLVLLNGISGIAVGWSTKILPRKFSELVDATLAVIDNKKTRPDLLPCYEYLGCDVKSLGGNSYEFTGKCSVGSATVTVTELPPDLSLEDFRARLNKMEDQDEITGYTDRSTKDICVEVRFRRADIAGWTAAKALEFLKLRSKSTERLVVLDWTGNNIKQYEDAWQLIAEFVTWRLDWYRVRYEKLIADTTKLLNWNLALQACMDKGLPAFLGKAANRAEIVDKIAVICEKIPLDGDQLDRIAGLASYRWARDAYAEIVDKIAELTQTIADYHTVLNDPRKLRSIYREEVSALKKLPAVR